MVNILGAVLTDGLDAVEAACAEALGKGVYSADVILNILARRREPAPLLTNAPPDASRRRRAFGTTGQIKLYGMKAAYDEIITSAAK